MIDFANLDQYQENNRIEAKKALGGLPKSADIASRLGVKSTRAKKLLSELIAEEIVVAEGGNRNRTYRLKA